MTCPNKKCGREEIMFNQFLNDNRPHWYVFEDMACWFEVYYCPFCGIKLEEEE